MDNSFSIAKALVKDIESHLANIQPDLVDYYKVFANEALFARSWLDDDLKNLAKGSSILEIGAGLMIMSAILVKEGWKVFALEPVGQGFSMFEKLQAVIHPYLVKKGIAPEVISLPIESFKDEQAFDYAFSVNVMEHVNDVEQAIKNVALSMKANCSYHFICPNYSFPYEPHFNIPTLFSKKLTGMIFGKFIFNSKRCLDPLGTWNSLNWITVSKIKYISRKLKVDSSFNRNVLKLILERNLVDISFSKRRSNMVNMIVRLVVQSKLHNLTCYMPLSTLPLLDCRITRKENFAV